MPGIFGKLDFRQWAAIVGEGKNLFVHLHEFPLPNFKYFNTPIEGIGSLAHRVSDLLMQPIDRTVKTLVYCP